MEDDIEVLQEDSKHGLGIQNGAEGMQEDIKVVPSLKRSHEFPTSTTPIEDFDDSEEVEEDDDEDGVGSKVRIIEGGEMDLMDDDDDWMRTSIEEEQENERVLEILREEFDEQLDIGDTTMVAEYSEEIFEYMADLEVSFFFYYHFFLSITTKNL